MSRAVLRFASGTAALLLLVSAVVLDRSAAIRQAQAQPPEKRDVIVVDSVKPPPSAAAAQFTTAYGLKRFDYELLAGLPSAELAVPMREIPASAGFWDRAASVRLVGTTSDYAKVEEVRIVRGRFLTPRDSEARHNVAVISQRVTDKLLSRVDPIGKSVRVERDYFLIVGVAEDDLRRTPTGLGNLAGRYDGEIYVPQSTMTARMGDGLVLRTSKSMESVSVELTRIVITLKEPQRTKTTAELIRRLLQRMHNDEDYSLTLR